MMEGWRISSEVLKYGGGALFVLGVMGAFVVLLVQRDSPIRIRWKAYEESVDRDCRFLFLDAKGHLVARVQLLIAALGTGFLFIRQGVSFALLTFEGWTPFIALHAAVWGGPLIWFKIKRKKRVEALEEQIHKWLQLLANALRSTPALGEGLASSARLLQPPISQELDVLVKEFALGRPIDGAITAMSERVGSPVLATANSAILIGRDTGGDLPEILSRSADALREMQRLEGVLRTKTAEARTQLYAIAAMPFAIFLLMRVVAPGFMDPLFEEDIGMVFLAVAFVAWLLGVLIARQILLVKL